MIHIKKNFITRIAISVLAGFLLSSAPVLAHQPRIVTGEVTVVPDPEISKAYYGKLNGEPHTYRIFSDKPFKLYAGVLVPDIPNQKKDVSAVILKDDQIDEPLAVLDGANFEWEPFFEEYAHDDYWWGPEYRAEVPAGNYEIRVWSSNNDSRYSLAVGDVELFNFREGWNAIRLIPEIKSGFFGKSPVDFIFSKFGYLYILAIFLLAAVAGLVYRAIMKRIAAETPYGQTRNIGTADRLVRLALGVSLFALAIFTTWSPWLLFFSGFCLFEAVFSWCGIYAALGRNTCPL